MKIDLEKELGLRTRSQPDNFPWLKIVVALCAINLVLIIIILSVSFRGKQPDKSEKINYIVELNRQSIDVISKRLAYIENMQRDLKIKQKKSKKEIALVSADNKLEKKHIRMKQKKLKKSGLTDEDISALKGTPRNLQADIKLPDEDIVKLNSLVDNDDSGEQVISYIRSIPSVSGKIASILYLQKKGDQWFSAALPLIDDNDPDADTYADNARYFYKIISKISDNNAVVAYTETKLNQLDLSIQKASFKEEQLITQEELEKLREELTPKETAEQAQERIQRNRRTIIKQYKSSKITHPYKSDWDPDPRVREERGIE